MARPTNPRPSYLLHKPSGQARVRINGRDIYLGLYNSSESWRKYHQLLAEYPTPQSRIIVAESGSSSCIAELVAHFVEHAHTYYRHNPDEKYRIKAAITPLVELYGSTRVDEFTPKRLKAVRQHLIDNGNARSGRPLSRSYVNELTRVIKSVFRWGVSEELVPVTVHQALGTVVGLRKGRTKNVREPVPIKPVPPEHIEAVLSCVSPEIGAMICLQDLGGMRPDEVTIMRPCDIDTTGDIWVYRISGRFNGEGDQERGSKTDWREGVDSKEILLGPKAQDVLEPWLGKRSGSEYLFSPREVCERLGRINRSRPPRDRYDDETYCQAVQRACVRAGVPVWTPGRLRHNAGTRIRMKFGVEAARLVLGHQNVSTTEIYAERDIRRYREVIKICG